MTVDMVVFDIGNVLIEWNPERFYDARIGQARRAALFAEVPLLEMNDGVDRGADFLGSVSALAAAHPAWSEEIMCWHDNWIEMASPACRCWRSAISGSAPSRSPRATIRSWQSSIIATSRAISA